MDIEVASSLILLIGRIALWEENMPSLEKKNKQKKKKHERKIGK
jgi:hypothetical protein